MDRLTLLTFACFVCCMRMSNSLPTDDIAVADNTTTTTTELPPFDCSTVFKCGDCVQQKGCFWCYTSDNSSASKHAGADGFCDKYPMGQMWPNTRTCSLSQSRYGVCWCKLHDVCRFLTVDMLSLIIAGVIIVTVLCLAAVITVYCCCCSCNGGRSKRQEERYRRELETRRQIFDERRTERESRRDEIRRKYALNRSGAASGVNPEETGRYNRFDNEMNDRSAIS